MRVALFNALGLSTKHELITQFINQHDIDIIFITETYGSTFGTPFLSISKPDHRVFTGGRRQLGGIGGWCRNPADNANIRSLHTDLDGNYSIIQVVDTVIGIGYFPPSPEPEMTNRMTDFLDKTIDLADGKPCIMLGDFNARMIIAGDHTTNRRGQTLQDWLEKEENFEVELQLPIQGRYTSFSRSGTGCGVTDLVIMRGLTAGNLIIHEEESLGGSDHRPVTFEISTELPPTRSFSRWNVRKLHDPAVTKRYREALRNTIDALLPQLASTAINIDQKWSFIKTWIESSAEASCGLLKFTSHRINTEFWTEELRVERDQLKEAERNMMHLVSNPRLNANTRQGAMHRITTLNQRFRLLVQERRRYLFHKTMDDLGATNNSPAFLRMVKGSRARKTKAGCGLDPLQMDIHSNHFLSTFGAPIGLNPNRMELPSIPPADPPIPLEQFPRKFAFKEVEAALQSLPNGKAAGPDGLMGELLKLGGAPMTTVFQLFLNEIYRLNQTPEEWKKASIVPVYKNKGSRTDIKYYRPIALTCAARRLYERLLVPQVNEFVSRLSDFQSGFRQKRNTFQQIFCLHEIVVSHPGCHNIFLDLRAAYDLVNRELLWKKLAYQFEMPLDLIYRLQSLFDHNTSEILINGHTGPPISNSRGLLQGSSLSPILFNFYIDDLIVNLNAIGRPKLATSGMLTNSLFFADDGNIHASTIQDLQILLEICESWSLQNDMEFSPSKCFYVGPAPESQVNENLKLYSQPLPKATETTYLGMVFNESGVDWEPSLNPRIQKVHGMISMLGSMGMNSTGWPASSSIKAYKSFIRPLMEYGLMLAPVTTTFQTLLQKAQNGSLRRIFSAPSNCSIGAMHRLANLETMKLRNQLLNINFSTSLHNSTDRRIPAVRLWRNRIQEANRGPPNNSLPSTSLVLMSSRNNPLNQRANWMSHLLYPLNGSAQYDKKGMDLVNRQVVIDADLNSHKGAVASSLTIEPQPGRKTARKLREFLLPKKGITPSERNTLVRWTLGLVCMHQECFHCHEPLSRSHGESCSAAREYLLDKFNFLELGSLPSATSIINYLLNRFSNASHRPPRLFKELAKAAAMIFHHCRNLRQKENGFWAPPEDGTQLPFVPNQQLNFQAPVTGPLRNHAQSTARREEAIARNRRSGRPSWISAINTQPLDPAPNGQEPSGIG